MTKIHHFSSYWKRQEKYDLLNNTEFANVPWQELELKEPYYFFVPKDFWVKEKYDEGFSVSEIFWINISWIETAKDSLILKDTEIEIETFYNNFKNFDINELNEKYNFDKEKILQIKKDIENSKIINYSYKPFDYKKTLYSNNSWWVLWRPRWKWNNLFLWWKNIWLVLMRNLVNNPKLESVFISRNVIDKNFYWFQSFNFPLYLYNEQNQKTLINLPEKTPNFNPEIIAKIEEKLGLHLSVGNEYFHSESTKNGNENIRSLQEENNKNSFSPENIFDYIYAVLHSKTYRETYKEFLKIDFPKIHFDVSKETFFSLAKLWEELRSYHLLENPNLIAKNFITKYEIDGDNKVEKVRYLDEKVYINDTQYFAWVPKNVWEFYIWWYQPAQKWLKDRKDRNLNYDDIINYSKIILSLKETIIIMKEIEKIFKI